MAMINDLVNTALLDYIDLKKKEHKEINGRPTKE
jgi:hypothetical protein